MQTRRIALLGLLSTMVALSAVGCGNNVTPTAGGRAADTPAGGMSTVTAQPAAAAPEAEAGAATKGVAPGAGRAGGGSFGSSRASSFTGSQPAPPPADFDRAAMKASKPNAPTLPLAATSTPPSMPASGGGARLQVTYRPNLYLGDNYVPGNGDRDRLEKLIQAGVTVDGKQVKLESFPRNYAQTFPIPTRTALNLVADTERAKIVTQGDHTYLQIGIQAMKGEMPHRPPLNIALVIDHSGSMADEHKLENARAAAMQLVDRLNPDDTFALIGFDNTVEVLAPAQHVRDKSALKRKIAQLTPGGGTDIYGGLTVGYAQARKFVAPNAVNRVILLSDGEVTAGVSDPQMFHSLCATNVENDIQTTSIGLGIEFNQELMMAIAHDGRGNYHFIKDGADTQTVFAGEIEQLTHIVAKDIKLRIQLADGIGFVQALGTAKLDAAQTAQVKSDEKQMDRKIADELGIPANRANDRDEPGIKMIIPDFYRGDSHVVMLEITVPPGQGHRKIADVFLKYKDLATKANNKAQAIAAIDYTRVKSESVVSINRNVKKNLLGFQTGQALTEAANLIGQGRVAEAVRTIDERMVVMGVAAREWQDRDLDHDGRLLERYKIVLTDLSSRPALARGEFGQYLTRSLTYNGYNMTR